MLLVVMVALVCTWVRCQRTGDSYQLCPCWAVELLLGMWACYGFFEKYFKKCVHCFFWYPSGKVLKILSCFPLSSATCWADDIREMSMMIARTVSYAVAFSFAFMIDGLDYCFYTFMNLEARLLSFACSVCEDFLTANMNSLVLSPYCAHTL